MKILSCTEGRDTITIAEYEKEGIVHPSTIQRRFGSWTYALEQANLQPSRSKIGISDPKLFENIKSLWLKLGRQPKYNEVKKPDSLFSAGTYDKRFGSWQKALKKFIEWVNSINSSDDPMPKIIEKKVKPQTPVTKPSTPRTVSYKMRYEILKRDNFKCKTCGIGASETQLHIDHIVPWSKGGQTTYDNLETKCIRCNLGKGNAFNV